MFEKYPDIINAKIVCEMLDIGRNKIYELIKEKEIKAFHIGRLIKIPKKEVIRYVENNMKKS